MAENRPWWLAPLLDLIVHVLVGSLLFAVIFAPAVGLELLLKEIEGRVSDTLMLILKATKVAVAIIDALLYIIFIARMGIEFVRELFHSTSKEPPHGNG